MDDFQKLVLALVSDPKWKTDPAWVAATLITAIEEVVEVKVAEMFKKHLLESFHSQSHSHYMQ